MTDFKEGDIVAVANLAAYQDGAAFEVWKVVRATARQYQCIDAMPWQAGNAKTAEELAAVVAKQSASSGARLQHKAKADLADGVIFDAVRLFRAMQEPATWKASMASRQAAIETAQAEYRAQRQAMLAEVRRLLSEGERNE